MTHRFTRTEMLIGTTCLEKLKNSKVAVFGVGGVGSYAVEGLARAGIGKFVIIDDDDISITNINRQIHAMTSTLGQKKVTVMKQRIKDINPDAEVTAIDTFYINEPETLAFDYDYIVDAIDTVTAKLNLIVEASKRNIPIISSMGTGNKLDPTQLQITDIYGTTICPLAKVMRKELRKRNITSLKVMFSKEAPVEQKISMPVDETSIHKKRSCPSSISFVPPVAGLIIAAEVVKDILAE